MLLWSMNYPKWHQITEHAGAKVTAKYNEDVSLHAKEQILLPYFQVSLKISATDSEEEGRMYTDY